MSRARQFIKDCTRGCSNELCAVEYIDEKKVISYHEWLTPEQALAAVEIAKKEVIERACEFIDKKANFYRYHYVGEEHECDMVDTRKFIEDFKKVMEDHK